MPFCDFWTGLERVLYTSEEVLHNRSHGVLEWVKFFYILKIVSFTDVRERVFLGLAVDQYFGELSKCDVIFVVPPGIQLKWSDWKWKLMTIMGLES